MEVESALRGGSRKDGISGSGVAGVRDAKVAHIKISLVGALCVSSACWPAITFLRFFNFVDFQLVSDVPTLALLEM